MVVMRKFVVFSVLLVGLSGMYLWSQQWQHVAVLKNEVGKAIMVEDRDGGAGQRASSGTFTRITSS